MIEPRFDTVIHAPKRLQICALLTPLEEAEFQTLRDQIGISDSVLSKHIKQLRDAGYVKLRKTSQQGRQRAWASLTEKGRGAFEAHVEELRRLANLTNGTAGLD